MIGRSVRLAVLLLPPSGRVPDHLPCSMWGFFSIPFRAIDGGAGNFDRNFRGTPSFQRLLLPLWCLATGTPSSAEAQRQHPTMLWMVTS